MSSQQEDASKGASKDESSKEEKSSKEAPSSSANKPPSIVYGPAAPEPLSMTFGELLDHHAEVRSDKPAVISHVQGKTISFKDLRLRSLQLARAFSADGIGKGDLVAISLGSRIEYFEVISLSI
jgi:non-ribosomal peptide synthetase component F